MQYKYCVIQYCVTEGIVQRYELFCYIITQIIKQKLPTKNVIPVFYNFCCH